MAGIPYIADAPAASIPLQQEAADLFARMTVAPNTARKALINETIYRLKQAGVWANLVTLAVHAAHDEQAARLCWKNAAKNPTKTGALTFTADLGYTAGWSGANYLEYPLTTAGDFGGAATNTCWFLFAGDYNGSAGVGLISTATTWDTSTTKSILTGVDNAGSGVAGYGVAVGWERLTPVFTNERAVRVITGKASTSNTTAIGGARVDTPVSSPSGSPDNLATPRTRDGDIGTHCAFGAMLPAATQAHSDGLGAIMNDYLYRLGAVA